ncbi:DUF1801 domain-containing protein [Paucibacter sp. JuS9]|uniref:DUF1801 domain-containing protein n=1 Tax=Paucibacter sp. JuS9 TaxID=3228748 RepID=UPI0037583D09
MNPEAVDDFLTELRKGDAERFALIDRTRELIHTAGPRLREEVRYGGLLFSARSPVCALFSYDKHLALEFSRGSELPDRHGVLEGEQGKRRHIKLNKLGDLFKKNVREYLELAFAAEAAGAAAKGKKPQR